MGKVLIVSPRFPPTNSADLHRVRTSLPWYRVHGWEPTVLCVDPATADCVDDPALAQALPQDVRIVRVPAWREEQCRRFGFGEISYRSLLPLYRAACELMKDEKFEIVFFSTTVFLAFTLGPLWKRRFGCKIVYDFQDPWYTGHASYTRDTVPGSWWKYRLSQLFARHLERFALRSADHIISVSDGYVRNLRQRYPWLDASRFTVLPFAGADDDYAFLRRHAIEQTAFRPGDGLLHWVYAGRAGSDMDPVLRALFGVLARVKSEQADFTARLRLHFVGTNYAPANRTYKLVEPLARERGVEELVEEQSVRVPYFETLALYDDAHALLLIGSQSPDYTASKLFGCLLAKKPVLALFHRRSLVAGIARRFPNVFLATFEDPSAPEFEDEIARGVDWLRAPDFDPSAIEALLEPWSAEASTRVQCAIFDRLAAVLPADATVKIGSHAPP